MDRYQPKLDFKKVTLNARNRWGYILSYLAGHVFSEALRTPGQHIDCPFHGGKKDFRFYKDFERNGAAICSCGHFNNGFEVLMATYDWDIKTAMREVASILWGETRLVDSSPVKPAPRHNHKRNNFLRSLMKKIWAESFSLSHEKSQIALAYFNRRGIYWEALSGLADVLRFHPNLEFYDKDENNKNVYLGKWPAIIASMSSPDGAFICLHRTYLDQFSLYTGKAKKKKLFAIPDDANSKGMSIKLGESGKVVATTEGIETALAIREATGLTVWPCFSDHMQSQFIPPDNAKILLQFGDRDPNKAGEIACIKGEKRLSNELNVHTFLPGQPGEAMDWNDILMKWGLYGFSLVKEFLEKNEYYN